jgi:hypothetical protein
MITDLDQYVFNHILSYLSAMDICGLLCVSKTIRITGASLHDVAILGFDVYDFVQFVRKHQVVSISYLKIENYNMLNDHCMWWYNSNCHCVQEVMDTFQRLRIGTLELKNVYLQERLPVDVNQLYLIDCRFDNDIINSITNLRRLVINSNFEYYYPDPFWNQQIAFDGLALQNLEYFACNGFVFEDQLSDFLENSEIIDSIQTFRIQTLMDDENDYTSISSKIKAKFRNAKIEVYL